VLKETTCAESARVFEEEAWTSDEGFSCRLCTKLRGGLPSKPGSYWASSTRARMLAFPSNRAEQHVPRPDQCLDCHQDHPQFVGCLSGGCRMAELLTLCRLSGCRACRVVESIVSPQSRRFRRPKRPCPMSGAWQLSVPCTSSSFTYMGIPLTAHRPHAG